MFYTCALNTAQHAPVLAGCLVKMDNIVLDNEDVVSDDGDVVFVASKTHERNEEVIVISDSEFIPSSPESAPVSPVKKKVKRDDDTYPLGEYSNEG